MAKITVDPLPAGSGWRFRVGVDEGDASSVHEVTVSKNELERFGPGADPARLVETSFRFLLEREPLEAILDCFALGDIARYFPEYETEIRGRL